jgi:myo-inositol-hexaphosphate 3-phosphohydrolase
VTTTTVARSVTRRKNVNQEKQPKVTVGADGQATLHLRILNETNVEVELERPTPLRLPHGTETVSRVNLHADDPAAFLHEARRFV